MHLQFLGGARTVTGSQLPADDRPRAGPHRLRDVPGQPERDRSATACRWASSPPTLDAILVTHAHLDHCGLPAGGRPRGLPRPDLPDHRDGRAGRDRPARQRPAPGGVREAPLAAGSARHPEEARRPTTKAASRSTRRRVDEARPAPRRRATSRPRSSRRDRRPAAAQATATSSPRARAADRRRRRSAEAGAMAARRRAGRPSPPRRDPEEALRSQPPASRWTSTSRSTTRTTRSSSCRMFQRVALRQARSTSRPASARRSSTPATSSARRSSGSRSARRRRPRRRRSSSPATSAARARRSSATRPPMTDADYVVVESTYGGREHEPRDEAVRLLAEAVRASPDAGGVLLIPAFAIGRTQEIVWQLDRLIDARRDPDAAAVPRLADGLARLATSTAATPSSTTRRRRSCSSERRDAARLPGPDDHPRRRGSRRRSRAAPRPYMIVASNGMLTGGRVVDHLRNLIDDPDATILFVGYQGEGTLGAHLQAGATTVTARRPGPRGPAAGSARSAASPPTRTSPSCSTGCATSRRASTRRRPATRGGVPRPRRPGGPARDRAEGRGARLPRSTSRTGGRPSRSTDRRDGAPRRRDAPPPAGPRAAAHRLDRR